MNSTALKVLLVDDDTFLLNMYSLKFTKSGFAVQTAQNASDALKKLKEGYEPEILLLDVIMPGTDGLSLLSQIRQDNLVSSSTVVMLTNQSDPTDIEKAKSLNVDGYIVKATTIPSEVVQDVVDIHSKKNKK